MKEQITTTLIQLMQKRKLADISISEITIIAEVGRASFYRNFTDKTDVLRQHVMYLTQIWGTEFESNPDSNPQNLFGSLFQHYKDNDNFYLLLFRNHLTELILDTILDICGPKAETSNIDAYSKSFFAYGLYGWIVEWMMRGMQESADEMNTLLTNALH